MSFTNPITLQKLPTIKASAYLRQLAAILTKKMEDGDTVPYLLIWNHIYKGWDQKKSEKVPLLFLGERKGGTSAWKEYVNQTLESGDKQKEYMIGGECTLQGTTLVLTMESTLGLKKLPRKTKARAENVLRQINKAYAISTAGGDGEDEDETTTGVGGVAAATATEENTTDNSEDEMPAEVQQIIEKYKTEETEKATTLSTYITELTAMFQTDLKKITQNVDNDRVTGSDLDAIKAINAKYADTVNLYNDSGKQVQTTFAAAYKKLGDSKEQLMKLSLVVKKHKKSLADLAALSYYQEKEGRQPTPEEVDQIQGFLKETLDNNRQNLRAPQEKVLRAFSYVLKRVGVNRFQVLYVEQTVEESIIGN